MAKGEGNYCECVGGSPDETHAVVLYFASPQEAEKTAVAFGLMMAERVGDGGVDLSPPCAISLGLPNGT